MADLESARELAAKLELQLASALEEKMAAQFRAEVATGQLAKAQADQEALEEVAASLRQQVDRAERATQEAEADRCYLQEKQAGLEEQLAKAQAERQALEAVVASLRERPRCEEKDPERGSSRASRQAAVDSAVAGAGTIEPCRHYLRGTCQFGRYTGSEGCVSASMNARIAGARTHTYRALADLMSLAMAAGVSFHTLRRMVLEEGTQDSRLMKRQGTRAASPRRNLLLLIAAICRKLKRG